MLGIFGTVTGFKLKVESSGRKYFLNGYILKLMETFIYIHWRPDRFLKPVQV